MQPITQVVTVSHTSTNFYFYFRALIRVLVETVQAYPEERKENTDVARHIHLHPSSHNQKTKDKKKTCMIHVERHIICKMIPMHVTYRPTRLTSAEHLQLSQYNWDIVFK